MKTLRTIGIALIFPLFDVNVTGFDILPDIAGYVILLPCFILMTEYSEKFAAPAVCAAALIFLEAAGLTGLLPPGEVSVAAGALSLFLFSLMMITWSDGMGKLCTYCKKTSLDGLTGLAGYSAAAVAPLSMIGTLAPPLSGLLWLASLLLSAFAVIAAFYLFSRLTPPEQGESTPPDPARYVTLSQPQSLEGNIASTSVFLDER